VLTPTASVRRIVNTSALASVAVAAHWRSHTGNSVLSRINAVARGETGTSRIAWGWPSAVGHNQPPSTDTKSGHPLGSGKRACMPKSPGVTE